MWIFTRDKGKGGWRSLETTSYRDEAHLQELIYREPQLMKVEPPIVFCVKEFGIPSSGAVDLVSVDEGAGVTLVECKLAKSPQVRREVLGQVLEYAAFLFRMPVDEFVRRFDELAEKPLEETITEKGQDWEEFKEKLAENLQAGNFNLVVAVDHINDQLRKSLLFLNAHSDFTVGALELEYIADDNVEILIPQFHGGVVDKEASGRSSPVRVHWDEERFFAEAERLYEEQRRLVYDLYDFTRREARELTWGVGMDGAYLFKVGHAIFGVYLSGSVWVFPGSFSYIDRASVTEFQEAIKAITGKDISRVNYSLFDLGILADVEKMRHFKDAVLRFKGHIELSL